MLSLKAGISRRRLQAFSKMLESINDFQSGNECMRKGAFSLAFEHFSRCCDIIGANVDKPNSDIHIVYEKALEAAFKAGLHQKMEEKFAHLVDILRKKNSFIPLYKSYVRHIQALQTYNLNQAAKLCEALLSDEEVHYIPIDQLHELLFEKAVGLIEHSSLGKKSFEG